VTDIHFPHGHVPGPVPLLVVLKSDDQIPLMSKFFPVPGAMFVGWGAQIGGRAFDAVVVAAIPAAGEEATRVHAWLNEVVWLRLIPNAAGILWL